MANSLYVSAAEPYSGKVLVSIGIMDILDRTINRVGFFRPIARPYKLRGTSTLVADRDIHLMYELFKLDGPIEEAYGVTQHEAESMLADGADAALREKIVAAYKKVEERVDFVLCEGTDFLSATSFVEDDFNSNVARDLNAPVLVVVDGSPEDVDSIHSKAKVAVDAFRSKGCEVLAVVVNKARREATEVVEQMVAQRLREVGVSIVSIIPSEPSLAMPSMDEVVALLGGEVLFGRKHLSNKVGRIVAASGSVETIIPLLDNRVMLVTHVDRHDVLFMAMTSLASHAAPNIGGIVLSGIGDVAEPVMKLLLGLPGPRIPIVRSDRRTYETIVELQKLKASLDATCLREIDVARQHFASHVDTEALAQAIRVSAPKQMTPTVFKYELIRKARVDKKRIVLPEGGDERILKAADALLRLRAVDITILGDPESVTKLGGQFSLDIGECLLVDPVRSPWYPEFVELYYQERKHKGATMEAARDAVLEPTVFGTLMVHTGKADGMVCGATHSTARTIRPAFQIIKTKRGCSLVSSVFFMCLADRVLVYGDCAVVPDPTAPQLAEIALASADTAAAFGIEPIVAMLSYSTGDSGSGADVDKVKEAVRIAKEQRPDLLLEGPLQYDAAVDPSVGKLKLPGSRVAGRATVLVFPDLNTGNNTYKAVQRSANAIAVGPVLQGLNKPVNDLSRGCLVEDIVNTVAITAIQAQATVPGS